MTYTVLASTLEDLVESVREVIVLMDDLPGDAQIELDLHHQSEHQNPTTEPA